MVPALTGLVLAFKLWLVADALRRREARYWPWIILFVPLGGVVYFFLIKLDDYSLAWIADLFQRSPRVEELELEYRRTPSFSNRVALAGALHGERRYAEAAEHYAAAFEQEPLDPEVLYGLGLVRIAQGDYRGAVQLLETLIGQEKAYRQYAAWPPLAYALFRCGLSDECLAALGKLVDENPRMDHKILLAHYLGQAGESGRARNVLQEALAEHDRSPRFLRRRNSRNAIQAKNMLKTMGQST